MHNLAASKVLHHSAICPQGQMYTPKPLSTMLCCDSLDYHGTNKLTHELQGNL